MFSNAVTEFLKDLNGREVHVNIVGAIKLPYFISEFECEIGDRGFSFGENECENFDFNIFWETIQEIHIDEVMVKLKLVYDGLTTYVEIMEAE
jgi:hypothetical protein